MPILFSPFYSEAYRAARLMYPRSNKTNPNEAEDNKETDQSRLGTHKFGTQPDRWVAIASQAVITYEYQTSISALDYIFFFNDLRYGCPVVSGQDTRCLPILPGPDLQESKESIMANAVNWSRQVCGKWSQATFDHFGNARFAGNACFLQRLNITIQHPRRDPSPYYLIQTSGRTSYFALRKSLGGGGPHI